MARKSSNQKAIEEAENKREDKVQESVLAQFGRLYTENRDTIIEVRKSNDNRIVMNVEVSIEAPDSLEADVKVNLKFEEKKKYSFKSEEKLDSPDQGQLFGE